MNATDPYRDEHAAGAPASWQSVSAAVIRRREALGLSREQAVALTNGTVHPRDWTRVESGAGIDVPSQARRDIALALGWAPDAINQIASGIHTRAGTRARVRPGRSITTGDALAADEDDADFSRLRELDPDGYRVIVAHARRLLAAAIERERAKKS